MEEFDIIVENEEPIDVSAELENDFLRGEKGKKGDSNTLTIGTVTKGEEASAVITGESPNQILNLVLPKGDKGDKGDKGEQGIQGKNGTDGQNGTDGYTPVKGIDYFTEEDIQQIESNVLDKVNQFSVQVVQELPTENIDDHTIYFVLKTNTEQNDVYDEYIYVNNDWEHIGTTKVDNIQALPVGGTTGQVLTKQSDTDGDANWEDAVVGDTLPVGTIVNYDGDTVPDGYVEVEDEGEIYSTTEQVIGKWINGKPLYRKTYEFKNITVGTSDLYLIDLSKDVNAEMILIDENASYWTLTTQSSMFIPVNHFKSTGDCQQTWVYGNVLYTRRGSNSTQNLIVTIKYTKTTDTVGV